MELHAQRRGEQTWRKRCLRRWYWRTLTLMLVAVERKPTMAHGGYDGGGQCLMQFFFFFPVQRHQPLFFSFLVCFCLVLLLLVSGEGGGCCGGRRWQRWRGRTTVVLLFPAFFLCNFLPPFSLFFFSVLFKRFPILSSLPPSLSCVSPLFCSPLPLSLCFLPSPPLSRLSPCVSSLFPFSPPSARSLLWLL